MVDRDSAGGFEFTDVNLELVAAPPRGFYPVHRDFAVFEITVPDNGPRKIVEVDGLLLSVREPTVFDVDVIGPTCISSPECVSAEDSSIREGTHIGSTFFDMESPRRPGIGSAVL